MITFKWHNNIPNEKVLIFLHVLNEKSKEKKTWNSAFGLAINRGSLERHISAAMSHASLAFSTLWKMDKK
jgi:hypothetical protein